MCEVYSEWCKGNVYGYSVEDEKGEIIDSCWGFYDVGEKGKTGVDDMAEQVRAAVNGDPDVTFEGDCVWLKDYHDFTSAPVKQSA